MAQQPVGIRQPATINGMKTDWTSLRGQWWGTGLTASHTKALNWKESITPTKPRGVHGIPLRRGPGFYTVTASITVSLECFNAMLTQFPQGYGMKEDNPLFAFKPYGQKQTFQVKWVEAFITEENYSFAQGQGDGLWVDLSVDVRWVEKAGDDGVFKCIYPIDLDGGGSVTVTG